MCTWMNINECFCVSQPGLRERSRISMCKWNSTVCDVLQCKWNVHFLWRLKNVIIKGLPSEMETYLVPLLDSQTKHIEKNLLFTQFGADLELLVEQQFFFISALLLLFLNVLLARVTPIPPICSLSRSLLPSTHAHTHLHTCSKREFFKLSLVCHSDK